MKTFQEAQFIHCFAGELSYDGGKTFSKDGKDGKDDALPSGLIRASVLQV